MRGALVVDVDGITGNPGSSRAVSGTVGVDLRLGDTVVDGPMTVRGSVTGTVDGVMADFTTSAVVALVCVRCLTKWQETLETVGSQHFGDEPDEDGYALIDKTVDLTDPAKDELALALPSAPLCRTDCKGLCPTCGSDLNTDPCAGHGEDSDSPFAALKDLLDP